MKLRRLITLIFAGLIVITWPDILLAAPPAQAPDAPPSVSAGRALWLENCLPCHGPSGRGDGPSAEAIPNPLPDFADSELARRLTPVGNFDTIKNGRIENMMPPWGNRLNDSQIWGLTAYVWRLSTTSENLAAGLAIYLEQCVACHGEDGSGGAPNAPAEINDFTNLQVMVQRSQADLQAGFAASAQHAALSNLSAEELGQALDYVRTFSFAVPQRKGLLKGQVINATNNQPQGNLRVTLHVFDGDTEIETLTTQVDSTGGYSFTNLLTDHALVYVLEGRYQDISYAASEPALFIPGSSEATLDLDVYDTTTNNKGLGITRLNILISFGPDALNVVQLFLIGNSGDQTYIGQNGQTFAFSLPEPATNVVFQNDFEGRFIQTEGGYADSQPILPGEQGGLIAAIYEIPYEGNTLSVDVPIPADVASMNVLMQAQGAELSSDRLQFVEDRQVEGDEFSFFSGANLRRGDSVTLELTGLDRLEFAAAPVDTPSETAVAPSNTIDQNRLSWFIIGLGGLAIVLVGLVYPRFRLRSTGQAGLDAQDLAVRRQKLLLLLAGLDDAFEAGELDEQVYRRTRAKYKAELVDVMEQQMM